MLLQWYLKSAKTSERLKIFDCEGFTRAHVINIKIVIELEFVKFGRDCEHSMSDDFKELSVLVQILSFLIKRYIYYSSKMVESQFWRVDLDFELSYKLLNTKYDKIASLCYSILFRKAWFPYNRKDSQGVAIIVT